LPQSAAEGEVIKPLRELEKEAILAAIMECGGVKQAARALGVSKSKIYDKMAEYGIRIKANHILREIRRQQAITFPQNGHTSL